MVEEFRALDRWLCNGGALPGDWAPSVLASVTYAGKRPISYSPVSPPPGYQAVYDGKGSFVSWDPDGSVPREALPPWPASQPVRATVEPVGGWDPTHFQIEQVGGGGHFKVHYYNKEGVYLHTHYDQMPPGWTTEEVSSAPRGVAMLLIKRGDIVPQPGNPVHSPEVPPTG